ncbi:Uncharacterized protein APZ42_002973 [Daphnia magna]|uniref:Uncharacterized protein n=1 Tax=Daphnia magna TaxID=35525 RepID=A0A162C3U9_9CRUS|nr:Uncharacterized protein APZ42_002973 [Daphnia magna]
MMSCHNSLFLIRVVIFFFFSLLSLSRSIARSPFSAHSLRQQIPPDSVPVLVRPTFEMRARNA